MSGGEGRGRVRRFAVCAALSTAVAVSLGGSPIVIAQERPPMGGPGFPPGSSMMRPPEASITVEGSGSVSVRPDTAEVGAGVVTRAATAAPALAENSATMDKVLAAAKSLGIADRDIRTTGVSVIPQRRPVKSDTSMPEIAGYEVSNQVLIKVRDMALLGRLLDTLVGQGANLLGGIAFSVSDPAPLLDQARQKAMADARHRADVLAAAAGVQVGRLISVRESGPGVPRFAEAPRMMAAAGAVPVAPGEQELHVSVAVSYAIK